MIVLDLPLIIAFVGDSVIHTIIDIVVTTIVISDPYGEHSSIRLLRLINILWIIIAIVGICAGIRKYQLMKNRVAVFPPQVSTAGGATMIVGVPVSRAPA